MTGHAVMILVEFEDGHVPGLAFFSMESELAGILGRKVVGARVLDAYAGSGALGLESLSRGAARFNDPFHWPVLGTTGKEGASLRCVILRQFLMPDRVLVCHSDARAEKVQEISGLDKVSWLFYHPQKKVQLRISGHATLHADDQFADEQWAAVRATSRLNYCAVAPPGTPVDRSEERRVGKECRSRWSPYH